MYAGFGICPICSCSAAEIFSKSQVGKKKKNFIRDLSKQDGFVSQEFLVIRGND